MKNVKILLAGPGTGKTHKVKEEVKRVLKENPSTKILVLSFTNATISDLLGEFAEIEVTTNNCMTLHSLALKLNHSIEKHVLERDHEEKALREYAESLEIEFDQLCKLLNCITFNQMIVDCVAFIKSNPVYAKEKIGELDLLIVDEYQDFNSEERELVFATMEYAKETIILGDDDQCIYGFKNADSEGIISLYNHVDCVKIEHENLCYRCPKDVVIAGNNLINKNKDRVIKEWKVHNQHTGLNIHQTRNQTETNNLILGKIKKIQANSPDATIMILSYVGFAAKPLIENLKTDGIPYVNWWQEKMGTATLEQIWWLRAIFSQHKLSNLMFLLKNNKMKDKKTREKVMNLLKNKLQHGQKDDECIKELFALNLLDGTLSEFVTNKPKAKEFFEKLKNFEPFSKYLLIVDMSKNLEKLNNLMSEKVTFEKGKVNLMSIHKSKGLQADYVFILGLVNGILPKESDAVDSIEAQRRLFFVALSRVKKELHLVSQIDWASADLYKSQVDTKKFKFAGKKIMRGETSTFVNELN